MERAADGRDPERPEDAAAPDALPRARPDVLLGHVGDVHRAPLQALRLPQHRGRRRHRAHRLPAALRRVHPRGEPADRRPRRLEVLRPDREDRGRAPGLADDRRGARPPRDRGRRRHRLPLGAARRPVRPRRGRDRAAEVAVAAADTVREEARAARPGARRRPPLGARGGRVPGRLAPRRARRRPGRDRGGLDPRVGALVRPAPARPLSPSTPSTTRCSGSCAPRASCWRRSSAACSRSPAPPYQGVFRNPLADPYLLGVAGGAGLGATLAIVYGVAASGSSSIVPLAAFAGAIAAVVATYVLGRSAGAARASGALVLAGRHRGDVHRGRADVRPAAAHGGAPERLRVAARRLRDLDVGRRRDGGAVRGGQRRAARPPPARARRARASATTRRPRSASTSRAPGS